ncbi:MAG: 3-hydroxybutyryl-CoA dehydrogenase [Thermoplasmatales archaeon]|nr:3-hydroxybutyryl-CoA dehydrogenase [Thermoplasmatales archaeon]
MEIKKIGVIGAGTMGHGIALVCAKSGYGVVMRDIEQKFVDNGMSKINKFLSRSVEKGKLGEEEKNKILNKITPTTRLEEVKDCDVVIEAILEDVNLKKNLFKELDTVCSEHTILASNTSTIPITDLASATKRPEKFIGMHFMNPVPLMKLVEVIKGLRTSDETAAAIKALAEKLDKTPVEVNDYPGFISNRILMPMINEAVYCLMEGVASKEAIDNVMKLGMNHPMGPLELADLIGLDICLHIMEVLYNGFSDSKYKPCPLLRKMVNAGYLGRKTWRGFYEYSKK